MWKARKSISYSINLFLIIINLKVILKKFLGLANLTKIQTLYIYKLTKVIIVSKNKDLVFIAFQIVALNLKDFNNSQKLLVVSIIISFNEDHLLKKKS